LTSQRVSSEGSPERLLLRAAVADDPVARDAYRAWRTMQEVEELDWPAHQILALLADRLEPGDDRVAQRIHRVARMTWLKTQMLLARAEPALREIVAADIPVMLCKGVAVLEHTAWRVEQRPMGDLDILVAPANASRAAAILRDTGFACPHLPADPASSDIYDQLHALPFIDNVGASIDLHWHFLHGALHPNADDAFWAEARPAKLKSVDCLVARREDVCLQVMAHGKEHTPTHAMLWVADVVLLLRNEEPFEWSRLVRQAREQRIAGQIAAGLGELEEFVPGIVPRGVARSLRWRPSVAFEPAHARTGYEGSDEGPLPPGQLRRQRDEFSEWVRRNVAPTARVGPTAVREMLAERWGLQSAGDVPRHAFWVASGRRGLAARLRGRSPAAPDAPALTVPGVLGFLSGEPGHAALAGGWWEPASVEGVWSLGTEAGLRIPLAEPCAEELIVEVDAVPHLGPTHPQLQVDVFVDGRRLARWGYAGVTLEPASRAVRLPPAPGRTEIDLCFVIRGRMSAFTAREDADMRPRGIALRSVAISQADADDAG
jgi:hypothetical protein